MKKNIALLVSTVMTVTLLSFGKTSTTAVAATPRFPVNNTPPNEVGIAKMLIEKGIISKNASQDTIDKGVNDYIKNKLKDSNKTIDKSALLKELNNANVNPSNFSKILNGRKFGNTVTNIEGIEKVDQQKEIGKGKLLVLLAEFAGNDTVAAPEHNQIPKPAADNNADLWVSDFSKEHYEKMLFTPGGYDATDQNGKTLHLDSMTDYYLEQSGGKYNVDGDVYGWYKLSQPESYYGDDGADGGRDNKSPGTPQDLVAEVLQLAQKNKVPLKDYDTNGDGIIDHLVIVHAGVDQSGGGGAQGDNAIWAHSSAALVTSPFDSTKIVQPYIIQGEDGGIGVFCHEFGHDLGLPDEYDTIYSGAGDPVGFYSLMSSGSWTGKPLGTMPAPMSPWAKIALGWTTPTTISSDQITKTGVTVNLDEATSVGKNNQVVKVALPQKKLTINTPFAGSYEWYGGKGDEIDTTLKTTLDLTGKTSASLSFKTMYDTEESWDFGFVQVSTDSGATWKSLALDGTTSVVDPSGYPSIKANLPGFTGNSGGWVSKSFDLKDYLGKQIMIQFRYMTDWGTAFTGFFLDDINVTADGKVILSDGAETENPALIADGWTRNQGFEMKNHYYLLEWRNHNNTDKALTYAYNYVGDTAQFYKLDQGMLLWYRDTSYTDNWVGVHPGHGFLGIVDSHSAPLINNGSALRTRIQIHDAAFNVDRGFDNEFTFSNKTKIYQSLQAVPEFNDSQSYFSNKAPSSGLEVPKYGLKFRVTGHSQDNTVGQVAIYK